MNFYGKHQVPSYYSFMEEEIINYSSVLLVAISEPWTETMTSLVPFSLLFFTQIIIEWSHIHISLFSRPNKLEVRHYSTRVYSADQLISDTHAWVFPFVDFDAANKAKS